MLCIGRATFTALTRDPLAVTVVSLPLIIFGDSLSAFASIRDMHSAQEQTARWIASLAAFFLFGTIIAAYCADHPTDGSVAKPSVVSVTQLTHDGVSKSGLVSDEFNLYITERPSASHVVAKFSLKMQKRWVME